MNEQHIPELPDELDYEKGRVSARLGIVAAAGYQPLPDVLLFHQRELGLTSEELNVALNILAHWYAPDRLPFPSAKTIARRMGVGERTVERYLTSLRRKGFLVKYRHPKGARRIKGHDLSPLIDRLKPLAHKRLEERRARLRQSPSAILEISLP
ncbi:MAG TPA: helix-turn-helix domain-containing protein [Bradyrhizobium sp.]|jgi:DNA-binding MarR family transcriptional regulator|nr:helix-turn-helix domain-containing protein [Bradyrhizobium sp.]